MKITFKNLGAIKETTLDLRPLTVIIGENNTHKTYVAYATYGLWKELGNVRLRREMIPTSADLRNEVQNAVSHAADLFVYDLPEFFQDSTYQLFRNFWLEASLDEGETEVLRLLERSAGEGLSIVDFAQTYVLPAERNSLVLTYKMLSNRRYRLLRDAARARPRNVGEDRRREVLLREQGDLRYPTPVEDFIDFLADIELAVGRNVRRGEDEVDFSALAETVETHLQGGHRTVLQATVLGGQEIRVQVNDDLTIDLYNASSSIKQLAPLLFYLRYRARSGDFLVIDEPEMNLHPGAQARLVEVLAILVTLGVRILLTTHSPYILAHVNTITASTTKAKAVRARQAQHLYLQDARAFLSMDQVSAYEMRDNQLRSLKDPNYGVRWDTLSDVSIEQQQRYFEIREHEAKSGKVKRKKTPRSA